MKGLGRDGRGLGRSLPEERCPLEIPFSFVYFYIKANDSGSRMATIAIDTETGKTEVEEWSYSPDVNYADVVL